MWGLALHSAHHWCSRTLHCLILRVFSLIHTRLPLAGTCMQILIFLVHKPKHHLTVVRWTAVMMLMWCTQQNFPAATGVPHLNHDAWAAVEMYLRCQPWYHRGAISCQNQAWQQMLMKAQSSCNYYAKFLIIFQDSCRTGSQLHFAIRKHYNCMTHAKKHHGPSTMLQLRQQQGTSHSGLNTKFLLFLMLTGTTSSPHGQQSGHPPPLGLPVSTHMEANSRGKVLLWLSRYSFSYSVENKNVVSTIDLCAQIITVVMDVLHLDHLMKYKLPLPAKKCIFALHPTLGSWAEIWLWMGRLELLFSRMQIIR